jgi:hypothetical protein
MNLINLKQLFILWGYLYSAPFKNGVDNLCHSVTEYHWNFPTVVKTGGQMFDIKVFTASPPFFAKSKEQVF